MVNHNYGMNFCTAENALIVVPDRSHGEVIVTSIKNHTVCKEGKVKYDVFHDFLLDQIKMISSGEDYNLLDTEMYAKYASDVALNIIKTDNITLKELLRISFLTWSDKVYSTSDVIIVYRVMFFKMMVVSNFSSNCIESANRNDALRRLSKCSIGTEEERTLASCFLKIL